MKPQFKDAIELHNAGYSPEEIAEELQISRATAYRWVRQHETSLSLAGIEEEDVDEDDFEAYVDELDDDEIETDSNLDGLGAVLARDQKARSAKLKTSIIEEFSKLVDGLQEYCQGSEWTKKELKKVVSTCNKILGQAEELQALDENDYRGSSVVVITELIKSIFKHYCTEFEMGVVLNWDDPKVQLLQTSQNIESLDETSFDPRDHERQSVWFKFIKFLEPILSLTGVQEEDHVSELLADLQLTREALIDDLSDDLKGEFSDESNLLDELEYFLNEYDEDNRSAFFGKRFSLPEILRDKIETILENAGTENE